MNERLGPYVNEDGDIWVPVEVGNIVAARKKANEAAMSRFAFVGMEEAQMSLHEFGWYDNDDFEDSADGAPKHVTRCEFADNQPCSWTGRAYHFRETGE